MKKRGKEKYIGKHPFCNLGKLKKDFNLQERKKLREIFDDLDADGSGAIGVDELEEPFIALDLASNRDSINDLIKKVDEDGGGEIDFDEFLTIIR